MAVRRSSWTAVGVRVGGGAEYVCNCLSPPFPRCERECRIVLGRPTARRLKRQSQLPHRSMARSKSQARPSQAEGPAAGPGSGRRPTGLFFQLLSPAQGGLGSCWEFA